MAIESTFEIGDLRALQEFDHVKQTRLRHVKNQMANFKNLIPYLETSLCADQKSYKNHDDPKHPELLHLKVTRKGQKLAYIKGFPPFRGKFEGL